MFYSHHCLISHTLCTRIKKIVLALWSGIMFDCEIQHIKNLPEIEGEENCANHFVCFCLLAKSTFFSCYKKRWRWSEIGVSWPPHLLISIANKWGKKQKYTKNMFRDFWGDNFAHNQFTLHNVCINYSVAPARRLFNISSQTNNKREKSNHQTCSLRFEYLSKLWTSFSSLLQRNWDLIRLKAIK